MSVEPSLRGWSVRAANLPEHARNPIHTDAGAVAAGFPRALVAGVTTYAYLTHVPVVAWGLPWVERGAAEVRFRAPVFEHDLVECVPTVDETGDVIEARTGADGVQPRATMRVVRDGGPAPAMRTGEPLAPVDILLVGQWASGYATRAGDDVELFAQLGIVHPAVWPALANRVVHEQVARGSWVHTRSLVRHHASAQVGQVAVVSAMVVRRFVRNGERAVLDVRIEVGGVLVASIEHEAIVALPQLSRADAWPDRARPPAT